MSPPATLPPIDIYQVAAEGETLTSVAKKLYGTEKAAEGLAALNGLRVDDPLQVGHELKQPLRILVPNASPE